MSDQNKPSQEAFDAFQLHKLICANGDFQEAKNEHQSLVKSVESKGINLKAANAAIKIKKSGKSEDVVAYLVALSSYLKILGYPITDKQMDMFASQSDMMPSTDAAFERGLYSGRMGEGDSSNPYAVGSEQSNRFLDGVRQGADDRRSVLELEMSDDADELISGGGSDEDDDDSASDLTEAISGDNDE